MLPPHRQDGDVDVRHWTDGELRLWLRVIVGTIVALCLFVGGVYLLWGT